MRHCPCWTSSPGERVLRPGACDGVPLLPKDQGGRGQLRLPPGGGGLRLGHGGQRPRPRLRRQPRQPAGPRRRRSDHHPQTTPRLQTGHCLHTGLELRVYQVGDWNYGFTRWVTGTTGLPGGRLELRVYQVGVWNYGFTRWMTGIRGLPGG